MHQHGLNAELEAAAWHGTGGCGGVQGANRMGPVRLLGFDVLWREVQCDDQRAMHIQELELRFYRS